VLDHVLPQRSKSSHLLADRVHQYPFESSARWVIPGLESIKFQGGQLCEVADYVFDEGIEAVVF
jgi:hypothetical protein